MRVGIGFDAHRFAAGRRLVLGGVEIRGHDGLEGHSDADVVLHALMDALLGAMGAGDIGEMFPDTDERYRNGSSLELLRKVGDLMKENGFVLVNADLVVICEEPRIAPHRDNMRENIARELGCEPSRIAIKGTTTEGMGPAGRAEGIMAQAAVLVDG